MRRSGGAMLAGLALTLAAFTFEAAPLFVTGVALTLLGGLTSTWVWLALRGARLERRRLPERVLEDELLEVTIKVRRGRWGLPGAVILDPLADEPAVLEPGLGLPGRRRTISIGLPARMHRRGLAQLEQPSLRLADGLELARGCRVGDGPPQQLLVLPRTDAVRWTTGARGHRSREVSRWPGEPMAASEVEGLRPYRQGTPASRIHWPALARGAGLLERRLAADEEERPLIVLDPRGPCETDALDAAVRATASLALELARRGGCRLLLGGERRAAVLKPDLTAWPVLHARLAMVEAGPGTRGPLLAPDAGKGGVFYVVAQAPERLPAVLTGPSRGPSVLVLPATLNPRFALSQCLEVGGCRGYRLDSEKAWGRDVA